MKSIVEMIEQQPIICEFQGFIIRPFDGHHLWMEAPSGEGTQIRKDVFLGALVNIFKESF